MRKTDDTINARTNLRSVPPLARNTDQRDQPMTDPAQAVNDRLALLHRALSWYVSEPQSLTLTPIHYPLTLASAGVAPGKCSCGLPYYLTQELTLSKEVDGSCQHAGKHPIISGFASNPDAQAVTPERALAMWDKPYNIGVVTGKATGLVVFDVDVRANGLASMTTLTEHLQAIIPAWNFTDTFSYLTSGASSRGYHLYFRVDKDDASTWKELVRMGENILPGVELKWKRGVVIASPSLHATGQTYELRETYEISNMGRVEVEALKRAIALTKGERVPPAGNTSVGFASLAAQASSIGTTFGGDMSWETAGDAELDNPDNPGFWSRQLSHWLMTGKPARLWGPGEHNDSLRPMIGALAKIVFADRTFASEVVDTMSRHGTDWMPALYGSLCFELDEAITSPKPWRVTDPANLRGLMDYAMKQELRKHGYEV